MSIHVKYSAPASDPVIRGVLPVAATRDATTTATSITTTILWSAWVGAAGARPATGWYSVSPRAACDRTHDAGRQYIDRHVEIDQRAKHCDPAQLALA